jgi:hypothetical protein
MNIDFGVQHQRLTQIGLWSERVGLILFLLTFWIPLGFFLGGDPFFLGMFQPALEVVFPFSGIGIFLVFFGQYIAKKERVLSPKTILYILGFLGYGALSSIFSFQPETSMLFLILWTTGFLAMGTGQTFFIEGKWKRWIFFASVLLGFLASLLIPRLDISQSLLAMASIWGIVFALKEQSFFGRTLVLLFYSWIIFASGHLALTIFAILLIFGSKLWLQAVSKGKQRRDILITLAFLFGLLVWGLITQHFTLTISNLWLPSFLSEFKQIIFGVGEGQFLIASQHFTNMVLIPEALHITPSGLLLTLFEKGIVGLALLVGLVFLPFVVSEKKILLPSVLTIIFLLLLPDLASTEQGILFLFPFLFAEKTNGRIFNFAESK